MAGITEKHKPLINREALKHLTGKRSHISFAWQDTASYEHAVSFTVAKMMDEDMLAETRAAMTDALANGTDFATFQKRLKPYLMARGWWGQAVMGDPDTGEIQKVQLGTPTCTPLTPPGNGSASSATKSCSPTSNTSPRMQPSRARRTNRFITLCCRSMTRFGVPISRLMAGDANATCGH